MAGLTLAQERYAQAFNATTGEGWQDWFNPDIPPTDQEGVPQQLSVASAEAMLLSGEVYWSHPGWIRDVSDVLYDWAMAGSLIKVQPFADWLLKTLSNDPLDREHKGTAHELVCREYRLLAKPYIDYCTYASRFFRKNNKTVEEPHNFCYRE